MTPTWLGRSATCLVLFVALAICACSYASSRPLLGDVEYSMVERHEQWMVQFGRGYTDAAEKEKRFNVFKENVKRIEEFNKAGNLLYILSVNEFADLTNEEFVASRNGYKGLCLETKAHSSFKYENVTAVPSTMDWRKKGAVTPVKDQGQCENKIGDQTTLINIPKDNRPSTSQKITAHQPYLHKGIHQLKTSKLISLSEQELVECDTNGVDQGCNGGPMDDAFKFIISNKGLNTETNYPYKAADATCNAKEASTHAVQITGYEDVPANSEAALLKAVAKQPVSVAIEASGFAFQFYSSGVFTGPCGTQLDHGVTAVGYGVSDDGTKYWLVKNSWGTSWGESGYIRMQRGVTAKEGLCGIAMEASYPTA